MDSIKLEDEDLKKKKAQKAKTEASKSKPKPIVKEKNKKIKQKKMIDFFKNLWFIFLVVHSYKMILQVTPS